MTPLRVAIDGTSLARDRRGMGRYARGAIRGLLAVAVEVTFLTDDARARALLREEFPTAAVASRRTAAARGAYDAAWFPFNGMRFPCAAPVLVTMHDAFAFDEPARGLIARLREQRPIRRAARRAAAIHTDSEWSRTRLVRHLPFAAAKIAVVPLAPDAAFTLAPEASPPAADPPYVLFVGGREPRKNAAFFVDAFRAAFGGAREARLVLVGDLSDDANAILAAGDIAYERVRPNDAELAALYRGARVVAVPSLGEGFGLVAVEAQACGAPVVAADASALPEAVGDAGIVLPPADRAAWVATLRAIVRDDALFAELRARSAARWDGRARDGAARSVLATLRTIAGHGRVDDPA